MSVWIYWLLFSVKKYFLNSPSTKMSKEQPVAMCPGFYKLNLNLMHMEDISQIERRKEILEDAKVKENEIVQQAITLMVNLIDNRFSRCSCLKTSIQKLKEGFRTNSNHLNTLADLAEMHRQLNVYVEAKLYDDAIQRVLQSNDLNDRKEVAHCLLEQGYACLFKEFGNNELKARLGLKDISKQLIAEVNIASEDRKQSLRNATHSLLTAQCLLDGMCSQPMNQHLFEKRQKSVALLQEGIKRLEILSVAKTKITLWKFYHAMACSRLYSSLWKSKDDSPNTKNALSKLTNDSCCLFLEVINLPQDIREFAYYRARSYAYIAYILVSRRNVFRDCLTFDVDSLENGKDEFENMQNDAEKGFLNAIRICPNDAVILHRYGESMWILSKSIHNKHDKLSTLEKADKLLTKAINLNRRTHLAEYGTRFFLYIDMFDLNEKLGDLEKCNTFLLKAREDGLVLAKEHFFAFNFFELAMVCQYLSKFPFCKQNGKEFVKDVEYLNEALNHVNTALRHKGQTYTLAYRFGSILFDLEEYETAVAWAKRAFLFSKFQNKSNIRSILEYMLKGMSDFGDIFNVLTFFVRKYKNISIISEALTKSLIEQNWVSFFDIITYLYTIPLNEYQSRVAEAFTSRIYRVRPLTTHLDPKIKRRKFERTEDVPLVYTQLEIAKVIEGREQSCKNENGEQCQVQKSFEYDFSAITGKDDVGWIKSFILDQLSLQLFDDDVALKGKY